MRNLTRTERVINHIEANLALYYSSLIEVINNYEGENFSSSVVLGSRRGKRYNLKYTFSSIEDRQHFINNFRENYPDVPIQG